MNKNIIIVLAGGFLIAVLVAILMQAMLGGGNKPAPVNKDKVQILVAAKDLKVGRELEEGDLKWQDWPEDNAFMGAVIRDGDQPATEAATGKLLRSLVEGQPMHMTLISEDDKGNFLSANVTKGMRAVGISVRSHVLADRLIRPGDYVDVMMTYRVRANSQNIVARYATETVIENARVLAVDKNDTKAVDEEENGGAKKKKKASKNASLTLEVTPRDAETLVLANKMGTIGLALRSIGDKADPNSDNVTTDIGMSKVLTELNKLSDHTKKSNSVRIYEGANLREVTTQRSSSDKVLNFGVEEPQQDYSDMDLTRQEEVGLKLLETLINEIDE